MRLLPFLFILYVANYLDRTSVAYAALGMSRDLGFSDRVAVLGRGIALVEADDEETLVVLWSRLVLRM